MAVIVEPQGGGWAVLTDAGSRTWSEHDTKRAAIREAKSIADADENVVAFTKSGKREVVKSGSTRSGGSPGTGFGLENDLL